MFDAAADALTGQNRAKNLDVLVCLASLFLGDIAVHVATLLLLPLG